MKRLTAGIALLVCLTACQSITEPIGRTALAPAEANFSSIGGSCTLASGKTASTGFDQYGYNRCAHVFNGTFSGWCAARSQAPDCAGVPGDTKLVMKWNEAWDVGNATNWSRSDYDAWLDNEIRAADGSFSEHFKTKWDAGCKSGTATYTCIWGQFKVLMDQGRENGEHVWWTKLSAGGFGS